MPRKLGRYREMASDVVWSTGADFTMMLANLISFVLLGRNLGTAGYGGYIGLYGITNPLGALSWAGLILFTLQRILREKDDPSVVAKTTLTLTILQGAFAAVIAFLIFSQTIDGVPTGAAILFIGVELIFQPIVYVTASMRQAIVSFPAFARLRIGMSLLRVTLLALLVLFDQLSLLNLAIVWTIGFMAFAFFCLSVLFPRMNLEPGLVRPSAEHMKTNLELSLPMAGANLQKDGDKVVLNAYGMAGAAGVYGAAFRVVTIAHLPLYALNAALFRRFLEHDDGIKGQHVRRAWRFSLVSLAMSLAIGTIIYFVAPLLDFVLGAEFAEAITIVRYLLLFLPLVAISQAPLNGLLGLGATKDRAILVISTSIISLGLYIALIPSMSWKGAVVGTVIGEAILIIGGWILLMRRQRQSDEAYAKKQAVAAETGSLSDTDELATQP